MTEDDDYAYGVKGEMFRYPSDNAAGIEIDMVALPSQGLMGWFATNPYVGHAQLMSYAERAKYEGNHCQHVADWDDAGVGGFGDRE